MANEYETLPNLKLALGIKPSDTTRDDLLNANLSAASRGIDAKCGFPRRRFYLDEAATARTFTPRGRTVPTADGELFEVDDIGATSGLIVEVGSGASFTTVDSTDYETQPDNAIVNGRAIESLLKSAGLWGLSAGTRLRVTAKWGWPAIPAEVVEATRIQAARLFKRKDSPEGVMGSAEWGVVRVAKLDPDVVDLISDFIRRPRGFA